MANNTALRAGKDTTRTITFKNKEHEKFYYTYLPREWYIRLVLEGEDRLSRNQESKEQGWTISYSDVSEEWGMLQTEEKSPLEMLVGRESVNEIFEVLTELQKRVFYGCFFHQKTQNELSKELGISPSAVSRTLSRAMNRMRRYYADVRSGGCNRKEIR